MTVMATPPMPIDRARLQRATVRALADQRTATALATIKLAMVKVKAVRRAIEQAERKRRA